MVRAKAKGLPQKENEAIKSPEVPMESAVVAPPKKRPARPAVVQAAKPAVVKAASPVRKLTPPEAAAIDFPPPKPTCESGSVAPPKPGAKTYTISQAADMLGIDQRTLRQWADSGYAPHILMPSGYRRFTPDDIERVREKIRVPEGAARPPKDGSNGAGD